MQTFLPYLQENACVDGALTELPKRCCSCFWAAERTPCVLEKHEGLMICSKGGTFLHRPFDSLVHICGEAVNMLSPNQLMAIASVDRVVVDISSIVGNLSALSKSYDESLYSIFKLTHEMRDRIPRGLQESSMVTFRRDEIKKILRNIEMLADLTEQSNDLVNSVEIERLSLPDLVKSFLAEGKALGFDKVSENGVMSLDTLRACAQCTNAQVTSAVGIPVIRFHLVSTVADYIQGCSQAIGAINQWVHDANHYMIRLRRCFLNPHGGQMICGDFRSAEALINALVILKCEIEDDIGVRSSPFEKIKISEYYRPYKLFHRFRYCYYGEDVRWKGSEERFERKAKYVKGIECVALNLYANAVKYLSRYKGEKEVETTFKQLHGWVHIEISSYGPLVEEEERRHITEDGFRASAVRDVYPGKGKGLARVKKICERAGYGFDVQIGPASMVDSRFSKFKAIIRIPEQCFLDEEKSDSIDA